MRKTNMRFFDLNLLVALKALLDEKHVTRAAKRIGLSQPAMSRALGRLRHLLKDPLLVKGKNGLNLTVRATELSQPLQNMFLEMNCLLAPSVSEPAAMQGEITIATRDNGMVTILPRALHFIAQEAPQLTFRILPLMDDYLNLLEKQAVDFIICSDTENKSATLCRSLLCKEDYICLVSAKNSVVEQGLSLKNFIAMKHCLVTISGIGPGVVDAVLAKQGLQRKVVLHVPHFLAASHMVADSQMIVTLPRKIGMLLAQQKEIVMLEPPFKLPSFPIYLYWHLRNQNNPTNKWIRETIKKYC